MSHGVASQFVPFINFGGDQMKEDVMGRACRMHGKSQKSWHEDTTWETLA